MSGRLPRQKEYIWQNRVHFRSGWRTMWPQPCSFPSIEAVEAVPLGHKIALKEIAAGESVVKYGVVIGRSTKKISKGTWVHLHVMESIYDERSSHLDPVTGAPKDTRYE